MNALNSIYGEGHSAAANPRGNKNNIACFLRKKEESKGNKMRMQVRKFRQDMDLSSNGDDNSAQSQTSDEDENPEVVDKQLQKLKINEKKS